MSEQLNRPELPRLRLRFLKKRVVQMKLRKAEILIGIAIVILVVVMVYPMLPKQHTMSRTERTRAKMLVIAKNIGKFYSDMGHWPDPASWRQQVLPYLSQENKTPEELLWDSWGTRIHYNIRTNGTNVTWFLQSVGRNRHDDKGANDDIIFEFSD
jgi:hypothetical protein